MILQVGILIRISLGRCLGYKFLCVLGVVEFVVFGLGIVGIEYVLMYFGDLVLVVDLGQDRWLVVYCFFVQDFVCEMGFDNGDCFVFVVNCYLVVGSYQCYMCVQGGFVR